MPRHRKPARLYFRKDEEQWVIRDGETQLRTRFGHSERGEAEKALAGYLANRRPSARSGPAHPSEITIGEVLARYADDKADSVTSIQTLVYSIQALTPFWAHLNCDAVKGSTCRLYQKERAKPRKVVTTSKKGKLTERTISAGPSSVRRELGVLNAALKYAHSEGILIYAPAVTLPKAGPPRDRWLTRSEVARLLRHASPHVRRFIILSIYTGRRASAVLDLTWTRVDLDARVIRFREESQTENNKRRGRIRMPRQLAGHLSRWSPRHAIETHVVNYNGAPVACVKKGLARAAARADLEGVTPHVLKHTAVTWAVKNGLGIEDAAEYFATSPETIRNHYWHHSPHHHERALEIIENRK